MRQAEVLPARQWLGAISIDPATDGRRVSALLDTAPWPSSEPENGTAARPRADVLHPRADVLRPPADAGGEP